MDEGGIPASQSLPLLGLGEAGGGHPEGRASYQLAFPLPLLQEQQQ